ncbi:MAG: hypothetical protein WCP28_20485 [Actinomycetes bacterium]
MSIAIDERLSAGQDTITRLRADLAETSAALEKAQEVLTNGDRLLEQIDAGLELTEVALERGRRVMPKLLIVVAVAGLAVGVVVVIRRRRSADQE